MTPLIVAHRGASADAPENTLRAFQLAWTQGADAIEGDFHLTRDGELVCVHDDDFLATAGDSRAISTLTLAEIRTLTVGFRGRPTTWTEPVPTIADVLNLVPAGKRIYIEIKGAAAAVPALKRAIAASGLTTEQLCVISFDDSTVAAVKQALPAVRAYWLVEFEDHKRSAWLDPAFILATLARINADGLDVEAKREVVDTAFVQTIRDAGYSLHTWTIDDVDTARHFARLVFDSITTNRPAIIRAGF